MNIEQLLAQIDQDLSDNDMAVTRLLDHVNSAPVHELTDMDFEVNARRTRQGYRVLGGGLGR